MAAALRLGIGIRATVISPSDGDGYMEVCEDWVLKKERKRIEQSAIVTMAGIASDVLYGHKSKHLSPSSNISWEQIYCAEAAWRPDICKACCLDWISLNTEKLSGPTGQYKSSDDLFKAIRALSEYQMPPKNCVGIYFEKAKSLLAESTMRSFIERLAKELFSKHPLCRNECLDIWREAGAEQPGAPS